MITIESLGMDERKKINSFCEGIHCSKKPEVLCVLIMSLFEKKEKKSLCILYWQTTAVSFRLRLCVENENVCKTKI